MNKVPFSSKKVFMKSAFTWQYQPIPPKHWQHPCDMLWEALDSGSGRKACAMEVAMLVAMLISQGGYLGEIAGSEKLLFHVPYSFLFHRNPFSVAL